MLAVVRRLFAISVFQALAGTVTGVLIARSLGPVGRGELATLVAPLSTAPFLFSLGLTTFSTRAAASGEDIRSVVGTLGLASAIIGAIAIVPGLWLAHSLAEGRTHLEVLLAVGMITLPVTLLGGILAATATGLQQWKRIERQRVIPIWVTLIGYLVLFALDELTVTSAGILVLAGGLLSIVPVLPILRAGWRPRVDLQLGKSAFVFGAKVTPITASQLLNHRLDQLLMVPLVSPAQLGIYAVAVTVSGVASMLSGAIATVLFPRMVAEGASADVPGAVRKGMLAVMVIIPPTAAAAYFGVPLLFGSEFAPAYPIILILLVGSVPLAGVSFFASAFTARNKIGIAGLSELVALAITVVGLILALPPFGAIGAAVVSLVAYTINFAWLAAVAPRTFGGRSRDYWLPRWGELTALTERLLASVRSVPFRRTGSVGD